MKVKDADLIISAVSKKQYPDNDLPEFVLLGRSNVGKSSFINTLLGRKNLAYTSNKPGKTQTMNFYEVNTEEGPLSFVDMPGYGYAKVSKKERARWGEMIEEYLLESEKLARVFLLIDSRVGPTEDDILMYDWLVYYDLHPVIIATKWDKLRVRDREGATQRIRETLELEDDEVLIPFSSSDQTGKDASWDQIREHLKETR